MSSTDWFSRAVLRLGSPSPKRQSQSVSLSGVVGNEYGRKVAGADPDDRRPPLACGAHRARGEGVDLREVALQTGGVGIDKNLQTRAIQRVRGRKNTEAGASLWLTRCLSQNEPSLLEAPLNAAESPLSRTWAGRGVSVLGVARRSRGGRRD